MKKLLLVLIAFTTILGVTLNTFAVQKAEAAAIMGGIVVIGNVKDQNGQLLSGATVHLYYYTIFIPGNWVHVDEDDTGPAGFFRVEKNLWGSYKVTAEYPCFTFQEFYFEAPPSVNHLFEARFIGEPIPGCSLSQN